MDIHKATSQYEQWLTTYTALVAKDIAFKHEQMTSGVFPFLRATFYRWAQRMPLICEDLSQAPTVLAVGDLHVENFGTWRDAEGRLIWGVNDFDEACHLPYTNDLVRLAVSALLAIEARHLRIERVHSSTAILSGYAAGLEAGGKPFVLAEEHGWLSDIAHSSLSDPVSFWEKMNDLPKVKEGVPESALVALEHVLPDGELPYRVRYRTAGVGSLGHPRFVAIAEWEGGRIAREAKALVPSGYVWAQESRERGSAVEIFYQAIMDRSVRAHDPFVQLQGHWIVRRLAPDCARIELSSLSEESAEAELLYAMGWETANIHLGSKSAVAAIKADIKKRKKGWLQSAAQAMAKATQEDWIAWNKPQTESKAAKEHS